MSASAATSKQESPLVIYISAGLGAFFLGIGDLLNNSSAATVVKLSETIRQNLLPQLESGGLVALIVLVVLGAAVCWIHQPTTRVDAFARGFSVFALMAVTAPYNPPVTGLNHTAQLHTNVSVISRVLGISAAYADDNLAAIPVTVKLVPSTGSILPADTHVVLREFDTGKIVGTSQTGSDKFSIRQPKGVYLLEVEARGFRRTAVKIQIDGTGQEISVPVENSIIPLGIQRLYSPERVIEQK